MIRTTVLAALLAATGLLAQDTSVPSSEQDTYNQLQGQLTSFTKTVTSQWNGQRSPFIFAGELLTANGNSGLLLLQAGVRDKYLTELTALQSLGVTAVTVKMGYPMLYQPFLQYNGDPQDYNAIIAFYQQLVVDVHNAGMKVIVESSSIFPGFFSTGSGLNVTGYYSSISYDEFITGVATINATIVNQIKPDYLNVGSEPTTVASNTGFTQITSPSGWAAAVQGFTSMLAVPHTIPIGAGIGTWQIANSTEYVDQLAPLVDYLDFHVYPINDPPNSSIDIPTNTIQVIDEATKMNKPSAISEAWLLKVSNQQFAQTTAVASSEQNFSQDVFSFWSPLDQQFLNVMADLAHWKGMVYLSPFWTRYYWSYLNYSSASTEPAGTLLQNAQVSASSALTQKQVTPTGLFVKSIIKNASGGLALASAANFSAAGIAPNSLVSIFGSDLADTAAATGTSLPNSLGGTSVTITDSVGTTKNMGLLFTSPLQINAVVPGGLVTGNATLNLTTGNGAVVTGNINLQNVNPGIFTKDGTGNGVPAAQALTYHPDGSSSYSNVFSGSAPPFTPIPITVNAPGTTVYLVLYGTGVAGRSSINNVSANVGGVTVPVSFAGAQGGFAGLDQINIPLPSSLAGRGQVQVTLTADGVTSNAVTIGIQ